MIAAEGLRRSALEGCELAHAGENGLWLDSGCCDNLVRRCHVHDLGASGIFVGPKAYRDARETAVERNVLDNNFIHDGSHIFLGSQGVWIGPSSYNQVTHNEISDFHHLGISVGHSWGYAPTTAHHNLIAFNHVHHICNGIFSDGGGIYTLGISPGTVIRNNIVHDVVPTPLMPTGGTGIYHDEGSSGILVEDNIVYRVGAGAFNQHYGRENVARNNIFAFGGNDPITCCRPEEHISFTFEGNIVLSDHGEAASTHFNPLRCKTVFEHNLYWDLSGKEPLFSGKSFAQWQQTGRDRDSRIADPQFYDPAHGDFRLKATSPALAMGFRPIATDQVGLYGDADWVGEPSKIKREPLPPLPPPPPPPPPRPLREDFETTAPGSLPVFLHGSPPDRPDAVSVVEGVAAGGKRSLKFTKVPGLPYGFQPHVFYATDRYRSGKVRFGCDVMSPAGNAAEYYLGIRDYTIAGREYVDGPSLQIRPDGAVVACGKRLTTIPPGQWAHLDFLLDLGNPGQAAVPKSYRLAITVAGKEQAFDAVSYQQPEFSQLSWFGFSSGAVPGGVFYVDNLTLELLP
jgi:hypothetical protein